MGSIINLIVILIAIFVLYIVKRKILDEKIGKIAGAIIWCLPFIIYSIVVKETAFQWIEQRYSSIIYIIIALILQVIMCVYAQPKITENNMERIYASLIRPLTSECVFMGVLIPQMFLIKNISVFVGNEMFFINIAMIAAIIFYVTIEIYETEEGMDFLQILLTILISYIHSLILCRTGFIWINLGLRIVYALIIIFGMRLVHKNRKTY